MDENKRRYFIGLVIANGVLILLVLLVLIDYTTIVMGTDWNWGWAIFFAQLTYLILGLRVIREDQKAAVIFLGYPLFRVNPGLTFAAPFITRLRVVNALRIELELPGDPEKIFRGEDEHVVPEGMVTPIRITFGHPKESDPETLKDDPYHNRMVAEVPLVVIFSVVDTLQFFTRIGSIDEAGRQIQDVAVTYLNEALADVTPAAAYLRLGVYNTNLQEQIEIMTTEWGILLHSVRLKPFIFSHPLNTAVVGISMAKADAESAKRRAEGERRRLILEGQGRARATKAELAGRGEGLAAMANLLTLDTGQVLGAETARDAITGNPNQKNIFFGTGGVADVIKNLVTAASTGKEH